MSSNKKQGRDDDFGVWLVQNYGSMSASGRSKKEAIKKPPAKKPTPAKKTGRK